ncbi:MAG TPA: peroxiredoxin [Puia sp.]|nr:peroxiredoxin [Puia sp.]
MSSTPIKLGQTAPDFTLYNSDKQKVSLSDFAGKNVLLLFFPQAFTGTCTKELCSTRDNIALYEGANAQVLGISVDSVFTLARYKEDQHLNFPLLSDFNKTTSAAYGALYDNFVFDMHGVSKRSAFVVDKQGIIRYAEVLETATELPDFDAIRKTLEEIK